MVNVVQHTNPSLRAPHYYDRKRFLRGGGGNRLMRHWVDKSLRDRHEAHAARAESNRHKDAHK